MSLAEFEILVLGGGCIGTSVFHRLARTGHRNLALVDSGLHGGSATAASGGMLRVFHESLEHLELAARSRELLAEQRRSGLHRSSETNGSLYFFSARRLAGFGKNLERMRELGVPFELLTETQGARLFPEFRWKPGDLAVWEPEAGSLPPLRFSEELLGAGSHLGGSLFRERAIVRISRHGERFRLCSGAEAFSARVLVLAGGAGMLPLLPELGIELPLESRELGVWQFREGRSAHRALPNYLDRETLEFARLGRGPVFLLSTPEPQRLRPELLGERGGRLNAADCYSPERRGVLGAVPGFRGLVLATGWGGTAFKFAPELGRRAALVVNHEIPDRSLSHAAI